MNDRAQSDVNGRIEIIEVDADEVIAEFPSEENPSFVPAGITEPGEFNIDAFLSESDGFLAEPALLGTTASDKVAVPGEFRFEATMPPVQLPAERRGRRALVAVAAVAALAALAVTGASVERLVRARQQSQTVTATSRSDVIVPDEPLTKDRPERQLGAVVMTTPSQPAPIVQAPAAREERPAPSSPAVPDRAERSIATTGTGIAKASSAASTDRLATNVIAPIVATPTRTAADLAVPPAAPAPSAMTPPTAMTPTTATTPTTAIERPSPEPAPALNAVGVAPPAAAAIVAPTDAIQRTLRRYQIAFSKLDVAAVRQVWPSVDSKALARAFDQVREENLTFDACEITVSGRTAIASCGGATYYVPKVGSKNARFQRQQWRFSLRQVSDNWVVDSVDAASRE